MRHHSTFPNEAARLLASASIVSHDDPRQLRKSRSRQKLPKIQIKPCRIDWRTRTLRYNNQTVTSFWYKTSRAPHHTQTPSFLAPPTSSDQIRSTISFTANQHVLSLESTPPTSCYCLGHVLYPPSIPPQPQETQCNFFDG